VGKIRRGGFVFLWWKGDHAPRHVYVFRDGRLVVKRNLDGGTSITGRPPSRVVELIRALVREGRL
jgi:hypothetical protein